jgi:hypothetical protein
MQSTGKCRPTVESVVLHRLWDHISNCYARAADARQRADLTADSGRKGDLLLMEENWKRLAQSYEISEQLERSLIVRSQDLYMRMEWQRVAVAPFDRVLELAVISAAGIDTIALPCRRVLKGWITAATGDPIEAQPTHWREWSSNLTPGTIKPADRRKAAGSSAARLSLLTKLSNE